MTPKSICFLDIETTGGSPAYNRIIDIGIVKTDGQKIIKEYETLVNPGTTLSPFITQLTGINSEELVDAPSFYEVKDEVLELLKDSVLVAHNVRFDYGFLKGEFRRIGETFTNKHFCTVKLARNLFPDLGTFNLDTIINYFGIECKRRHRAYDDAKVLWDFYQIAKKTVDEDLFEKAISKVLRKPSVPINISEETLAKLPETSGVYIFYGDTKTPLYIGKSVNIKDRVLSHFSNDYLSSTELQIAQQIKDIEVIQTAGELGALLLESTLIKKQQPLYNRQLRYARKMIVVLKKEDEYHSVEVKEVDRIDVEDVDRVLATFKSQKQMKEHLYELSKQYSLCPKILGLEKVRDKCFYYHLNMCFGACFKKEAALKYNLRFEEAFYKYKIKKWMFDSPILVKEEGELKEGFVVDKWCLLGSVKDDEDLNNLTRDYNFDLDTYKILVKFLLFPPSNIKIQKINLSRISANVY